MELPKTCQQKKRDVACQEKAAYRYTWPGTDEAVICEKCSVLLRNISTAIGLYVQLIPLNETEVSDGE